MPQTFAQNPEPPVPPSLADSFARAGFLVIAPDLFNGSPSPADMNSPSFGNSTFNISDHGPAVTEPILERAINYARTVAGSTRVAMTGYCFGGRYSFRFANVSRGVHVDAAFAAHPSSKDFSHSDEILRFRGTSENVLGGRVLVGLLSHEKKFSDIKEPPCSRDSPQTLAIP